MRTFKSPDLPQTLPFYQDFSFTYYKRVAEIEKIKWQDLVTAVVSDQSIDLNGLTPLQAAVLTLANLNGYENGAASSAELFVELPLHAEVYQKLLQIRLHDEYSDDIFYDLLRQKMPVLMKRIIALDSVIMGYYRSTMMSRDHVANPELAEYYKSPLDEEYFVMTDSFDMVPNPELIALFKQHAQENNVTEDQLGRTANRGCPFLRVKNQDALIGFAINELIYQHRKQQNSVYT
jgi:hypothetical protein